MGTLRLLSLRAVDESSVFQILYISKNALHHVPCYFLLSLEHSLACEFDETRTVICGSLKNLWCDNLAFLELNLKGIRCYLLSPSVSIVTLASLLSLKGPLIWCEKVL